MLTDAANSKATFQFSNSNERICRMAYADGLAERSSESPSNDPESKYITTPSSAEGFDVDLLFTGLLDR